MPSLLPSDYEILARVSRDLKPVLDAAQDVINSPDYIGSEWLELCCGNRLLPLYVMIDFCGNILHVEREATTFADEKLTITYLPSWFAAILNNLPARAVARYRSGDRMETVDVQVSDRELAVPMRFTINVAKPTGTRLTLTPTGETPLPGTVSHSALLPQISYDLQPSQGSMLLTEGADPEKVAALSPADGAVYVQKIHWIAPSLKVIAGPGVEIAADALYPGVTDKFDPWSLDFSSGVDALASSPFWGYFVMEAAKRLDDHARMRSKALATSQQALQVRLERYQNTEAVPPPGAPRRSVGVSEVELLGASFLPVAHFEEQTRPDGVDLLCLTSIAAAALARQRSDPIAAMRAAVDVYLAGTHSALPMDAGIPISIRVDPMSAEDRFVYSVTALKDGKPTAGPPSGSGKLFRISVIRTELVKVKVDWFFGPEGSKQIADIVDYREQVVGFDAVPVAILDHGRDLPAGQLERRDLSNYELGDLVLTALAMIPFPPCQVLSDLNDYATLLRYLYDGKDTFGREMTRVDFAVTLAGILLPEVLEAVAKKGIRLVATYGQPGLRIVESFVGLKPAALSATVTPLLKQVTP